MPLQLNRVAKRAALGLARLGSYSGNASGDLIVSFSTAPGRCEPRGSGKPSADRADRQRSNRPAVRSDGAGDRGSDRQRAGRRRHDDRRQRRTLSSALPHDELRAILKRYNRLEEQRNDDLPRVTYSNTGEDFSGVHAHLDEIIPEAEARLLGKAASGLRRRARPDGGRGRWSRAARSIATSCSANFRRPMRRWSTKRSKRRAGCVSRVARHAAGRSESRSSAPAPTSSKRASGTFRSPAWSRSANRGSRRSARSRKRST